MNSSWQNKFNSCCNGIFLDALTKRIALRYDPNNLQSFSWWVWQLNIDINHEKISFEDTKEKKIYAITKELVEIGRAHV